MKFTTVRELDALKKVDRSSIEIMRNTINKNFNGGRINEESCEKAFNELDNLIEKAGVTKYFKRTGAPGNYKYFYTEADYKASKKEEKDSKTTTDIDGKEVGKGDTVMVSKNLTTEEKLQKDIK